MRRATIIALFAVMLAGTAFAGDNGNGCKLQGTWITDVTWPAGDGSGDYTLKMFITFHGTGDNDGTLELDYANPWPGSGLLWTINRGVWKKSGGNTYRYTYYVALADEMGNLLGALRHDGTATLQDCNTMHLVEEMVLVDPQTLEPFFDYGGGEYSMQRMNLEEPYQ
jgi:hypothetical protein